MSNTTDPKKTVPKTSVPKPIRPVEREYPEDAELAAWDARMGRKSDPSEPLAGKNGRPDLSGLDKNQMEFLQRQWATASTNPKNPLGFSGGGAGASRAGAGRGDDTALFEEFVTTYYSSFLKK